jgi:phospholipid N-methyltransferase
MKNLIFFLQYILKPRTVGAIIPSSKYLGNRMMDNIDFPNANYIVEYGPGTGVFTEKLIEKRNPNTVIMLVECNQEFYKLLKEKYKNEKNFYIVNGKAENIDTYLTDSGIPFVDYIVSGLPFGSLPRNVSKDILAKTKKALDKDGKFITFQYTKCRKKFISQFFKKIDVKREFRNFPPAYIFNCGTKEK